MLRVSFRRFAIGAYSLFMREQKSHPKLVGLPVSKRGKALAELYRNLTPKEKESLVERAKNTERQAKKIKKIRQPGEKRPLSKYAQFVKAHIHKFDALPHKERMKAVAKLWSIQKNK